MLGRCMSLSALSHRRLSHNFASTSDSSLHGNRSRCLAYNFAFEASPGNLSGPSPSPAHSSEEELAELERWASVENWSGKRKADGTRIAKAESEQAVNGLKINRDLLLYKARRKQQQVFKLSSHAERLKVSQESEEALRRCISLDPTDARAYVTLGKLLQQQHRLREARQNYEDAVAVTGGKNAYVWQAWAMLEGRAGNSPLAKKYFKAAVLVNPSHAAAWHAWGMLEKREGNFAAAKDLWIKGVKKTRGPPNPHLYQSLAVLAGEMGFVDEARAWFRKGTESVRGAQSHALWHAWALLEERRGEPKVVRYLYGKGLEVSPQSRYIHLAWAMYEKNEGAIDNCRKLLERGRQRNPKDAAIVQALALLESEDGNLEEARTLFQAASDLDPRMVHVWHAWGMLEMKAGKFSRARHLFQSGIWSSGENAQTCHVWQAWATLEYRAGNFALARSMYNCAVKADPSSEKAWKSWLHMEEELGEERRALVLETAMRKGGNPATLPKSFATPEMASMEEPSMIETVVTTVNEWLGKLDRKRRIVKRSSPAYLSPGKVEEEIETDPLEKIPAMKEMMKFHERKLKLPDL